MLKHVVTRAEARAEASAGKRIPINNAIIEMTTSSSMSEKPRIQVIVVVG
jgi:hypothetical protein